MSELAARDRRGSLRLLVAALALLAVAALGVQAWAAWKRDLSAPVPAGAGRGAWIAVTLINGQVYYGKLAGADAHRLSLSDVYYVNTAVDAATNQRSNQLVSRQRTDWHAPLAMTIGVDKVMMVEQIGLDSQLARLIAQEQQNQPAR